MGEAVPVSAVLLYTPLYRRAAGQANHHLQARSDCPSDAAAVLDMWGGSGGDDDVDVDVSSSSERDQEIVIYAAVRSECE